MWLDIRMGPHLFHFLLREAINDYYTYFKRWDNTTYINLEGGSSHINAKNLGSRVGCGINSKLQTLKTKS